MWMAEQPSGLRHCYSESNSNWSHPGSSTRDGNSFTLKDSDRSKQQYRKKRTEVGR